MVSDFSIGNTTNMNEKICDDCRLNISEPGKMRVGLPALDSCQSKKTDFVVARDDFCVH